MICIMCKGTFIPECKQCPSDLKMLQWHFSGSFVHTCQGKCDGRWQLQLWLLPPESTKTTKTLLESGTHQPHRYTHNNWMYFWKRKKKDFHLVLTRLISYKVRIESELPFLSCTIWGDQGENNEKHIVMIHLFISHKTPVSCEKAFQRHANLLLHSMCLYDTSQKRWKTKQTATFCQFHSADAVSLSSRKKLQTMTLSGQLWCGSTSQIIDYLGNAYLRENDFNTESHVMSHSHACTEVKTVTVMLLYNERGVSFLENNASRITSMQHCTA